MKRCSIGCGRLYHSLSCSFQGSSRSMSVGSSSGPGTSGLVNWCSMPRSRLWKEQDMLKIARPCWMATTRRVVKERPSRMRSTS